MSTNSEQQARAQLESIVEMVAALDTIDEGDYEDARERIEEDPLSIDVRSGWYSPGARGEPEEFRILLCTGGPAVQLTGELNRFSEPESVQIEHQDWFEEWSILDVNSEEREALLTYACQFYYAY